MSSKKASQWNRTKMELPPRLSKTCKRTIHIFLSEDENVNKSAERRIPIIHVHFLSQFVGTPVRLSTTFDKSIHSDQNSSKYRGLCAGYCEISSVLYSSCMHRQLDCINAAMDNKERIARCWNPFGTLFGAELLCSHGLPKLAPRHVQYSESDKDAICGTVLLSSDGAKTIATSNCISGYVAAIGVDY